MTREEFLSLYKKYLDGNCTPEEEEMIFSWKDEMQLLDDAWEEDMGKRTEIYNSINSRLSTSIRRNKPRFSLHFNNKWLRVAAAVIIIASLALLLKPSSEKI